MPPQEGFTYDASQDEIDEALADLDPVTLKFQPSAMSEKSILAPNGLDVKKAIEERSGGKITVDIVWGQAIASYADVDDALADGRVDLAFTLPSYTPAEYPAFDALGTAMSTLPSSPVASDLAANAAGVQAAWETPEVIAEFEDKNLVPLIPMLAAGGYSTMCSKPMASLDDWKGKQLRVGSAAAGKQVTDLGATPVSLSFPETYEALQREPWTAISGSSPRMSRLARSRSPRISESPPMRESRVRPVRSRPGRSTRNCHLPTSRSSSIRCPRPSAP